MKISSQDKMVLASAFVIGAIAGAYLYLMGYAPQYGKTNSVPTEATMMQFTVEGDMYGGDRMGQAPSFQLLADGTYRYIPFTPYDATSTINNVQQGKLPKSIMTDLSRTLTTTDLTLAAKTVTKTNCSSMVDGIDYRYSVMISGAEFKIDTCATALEKDSPIGVSLQAVWDYLDKTHSE